MEKLPLRIPALIAVILLTITGCFRPEVKNEAQPFVSDVVHPEWSKNSVVYEVNLRQYTSEGTFIAFEKHLPRLKELGVDVLWFMPSFPIGIVNKKGELGSYYSVKDFMDVNPAYGSLNDFKMVINKAHELGMRVLLDWVPNHTSWDNILTVEHPEWYLKDSTGNFRPPIGTDWTDVIQLDWSHKGLQDYMVEAMKFWVNLGVDGFRVDHPHNTPPEFWERTKRELTEIRPVLMLGEIEDPAYMGKGFDMNYAWEMHHIMKSVAQGKDSLSKLVNYYKKEWKVYPNSVYRLQFLTNHDENSWAGTVDSLFREAQKPLAALIFTAQGVPLIYSGQEIGLNRKLKFFERDPIIWDSSSMTPFYKDLISLKKKNKALWNGDSGGPMIKINTNTNDKVFAFYREKEESRVLVFLNLSKKNAAVRSLPEILNGDYTDYFTGLKATLPLSDSIRLEPWGYKILIR